MARTYKVLLIVFLLQTLIQVSISGYDIHRGDRDKFSNDFTVPIGRRICDDGYCSCNTSKTFIYVSSTQKGKCVRNDEFLNQSGCTPFSYLNKFTSIQIVYQRNFGAPTLLFHFWAKGICKWNSTAYTVRGDNWEPTYTNVGSISVFSGLPNQKTLQINNPNALLSTFPGMLLRIKIECHKNFSTASKSTHKCLVLKIEGKTNFTISPPSRISTKPVPPKPSHTTSNIPLSIPTTSTPSESQNDARENDENDARNLVPILLPILLLFVVLIVLCGVFLYRKRQRSRIRSIDKEFDDENTLPSHATLTKQPQASGQFYAVPGSQINAVVINDNVTESTNPNRRSVSNFYEYDYATSDSIPTNPNANQNPIDRPSQQSSHTNPSAWMNHSTCSSKKTQSTMNSEDNLGHNDQASGDPYYFSLEEVSSEHIYDKVTEEPQEHIYDVSEKTI